MITNKNRIFVCGVHGVGKSSFIKEYKPFEDYKKYSCSSLIRKYSGLEFKDKQIDDLDDNQETLLSAVSYFVNEDLVLFDGHITLFNKSGEIQIVPPTVLRSIAIEQFLLLKAPPIIIYNRLVERDGHTWLTPELIGSAQDNEEKKVIEYSKILGIDYETFTWSQRRSEWERSNANKQ